MDRDACSRSRRAATSRSSETVARRPEHERRASPFFMGWSAVAGRELTPVSATWMWSASRPSAAIFPLVPCLGRTDHEGVRGSVQDGGGQGSRPSIRARSQLGLGREARTRGTRGRTGCAGRRRTRVPRLGKGADRSRDGERSPDDGEGACCPFHGRGGCRRVRPWPTGTLPLASSISAPRGSRRCRPWPSDRRRRPRTAPRACRCRGRRHEPARRRRRRSRRRRGPGSRR